MKCARCKKAITKGQRSVADPCCSAPDCENTGDWSHYDCLPRNMQIEEDDYVHRFLYGPEEL